MAEKQKNSTDKKLIKPMFKIIGIIIMIIVLIVSSFFAILDGIIETVKKIIKGILEVFSHSMLTYGKVAIGQVGNFVSKHTRSGFI